MLRATARKAAASSNWMRGLELFPLLCGSLPHIGPAADLPASFVLPSLQAKRRQQHVSLHSWQLLLGSAAAASKKLASLPTLSGSRTTMTAATDSSPIAASPLKCLDKGTSTGTGATSGSSPAQPCSLHACLLRYGITDLAAFSAPKHLALSQEAVSSNVDPKLAALAAEGLSPKQMEQVIKARNSPLACSFTATFLPNLLLLRQIGAYTHHRRHPKAPQLTAAGKVLADSPAAAAMYLSRDPSKVQQLLQWLERSLRVGLEQLAACNSLCSTLTLAAVAASAVHLLLQKWQVPTQQVAHMLVRQPRLFYNRKPEVLSARLYALQQHLGLDAAAALQLVTGSPTLLTSKLEARLPLLLRFLDGYMGEEGAGCRLVRTQPALCTIAAAVVERSVRNLAARGYSQQDIRQMISKQPNLLLLNLDSPLQRQKLDWMERVSPWTLHDFLSSPTYLSGATTRRLAARLALLRECGLSPPSTPGLLVATSGSKYMRRLKRQLERQGRELPWASWAQWEEAWLGTDEGREWGYLPLKD